MKFHKKILVTSACVLASACSSDTAETNTPPIVEASSSEAFQPVENKQYISVTRAGNSAGRTVILIPGLACSPEVWKETVEGLLNYDLRLIQIAGFAGLEPTPLGEGSIVDHAAQAINDHLTDNPGKDTVIIGHSLGGVTALKTAMIEDDISEIIIVDSLPYLSELMMPNVPPANVGAMASMMAEQMKALPKESFDAQQQMSVGRLAKSSDRHADILKWSKLSDQNMVATAMGELLGADIREEISTIKAKTLVLAAWDPNMGVPREQIESLYNKQYEKLPDYKVEIVPDSYHFIMYDQFEPFMALVKDALEN